VYIQKIPYFTGEEVINVPNVFFSIVNIFAKIKLLVKEFKLGE